MNQQPHVITIDAALRNVGLAMWSYDTSARRWSLLKTLAISTKPDTTKTSRASCAVTRNIQDVLDALQQFRGASRIAVIGAEIFDGGSKSASGTKSLALMQGMIVTYAKLYSIPLVQVSPKVMKKKFMGKENASKTDIMRKVVSLYPQLAKEYHSTTAKNGFNGKFEHVADAIGIMHVTLNEPELMQAAEETMAHWPPEGE